LEISFPCHTGGYSRKFPHKNAVKLTRYVVGERLELLPSEREPRSATPPASLPTANGRA
jgi:hypothetical protein